jgi:hypothetical protein
VLAAGVTYAASSLSTQRIGLSSEPVNAGRELARGRPATRTPTSTPTPKPKKRSGGAPSHRHAPAGGDRRPHRVPTVDDHRGGGDDSGGGGSGSGRAATIPRTTDWKRRRSSAMILVLRLRFLSL